MKLKIKEETTDQLNHKYDLRTLKKIKLNAKDKLNATKQKLFA